MMGIPPSAVNLSFQTVWKSQEYSRVSCCMQMKEATAVVYEAQNWTLLVGAE